MADLTEKINAFIVSGEFKKGRKALHEAGKAGLYKSNRLAFAGMARRLDLPMLGLRILTPAVHLPARMVAPDTVRCEYAASLTAIGACTEAGKILRTVSEATVPEALLFKAFNAITQWNYREACIYLRRYVAQPELSEYQRMTGQANLVAGLIYEQDPASRSLLDSLLPHARTMNYTRILAYLLLRKGELEVVSGNWEAAYGALTEALHISEEDSMDRFLIKKWSTIVSLYAHQNRHALSLYELQLLRVEALVKREWETVRNLDYHRAKADHDQELARRVYFGTPHASFRQRLLAEFPHLEKEREFAWRVGNGTGKGEVVLEEGWNEPSLRPGQLGHSLLFTLTLDFYRPMKMAELFGRLFPEEIFNVQTSPVRVRKVVERTRTALRAAGVTLEIRLERGMYDLTANPGVIVRVPLERKAVGDIEKLRQRFPSGNPFTTDDVRAVLNVSLSSAIRRVRDWRAEGVIKRRGARKQTSYDWRHESTGSTGPRAR